jgi:hypothetical protein
VTPAKLKEIFQTFVDQQMDLSAISGVEPVFNPAPAVDGDGVLVLQGSYPTTPMRVNFRLKYVNEKSAWKLIGIKVDAKPAGVAGKLPTNEEAETLVRESLIAFNAAVQTKSFVDFHKQIAAMWQKQVTPERLAQLFAPFIKAEADLSGITQLEPTFDTPPAINDDGILELKGSYPVRPSKVMFELSYLFEGTEWKLVGINVSVPPTDDDEGTTKSSKSSKTSKTSKSSKKSAAEDDDDAEE